MNPSHRPRTAPRSEGPREPDPWDGLLLVDKPATWTSHDVVAKVRKHFGFPKVGHGGTLDPMATGLLVLLIGRATRVAEFVMGSDKTYEGVLRLGVSTDSHDADGQAVEEKDASGVTREDLQREMSKWVGDVMQTPPMVSAIKKAGVPLYKLARKGKSVEREPRLLHIYSFQLLDFSHPRARFRLECTKGTYVRTLCHDIGQALGCGAHLTELRRTRSGRFNLADARPLEELLSLSKPELCRVIIPLHQFRHEDLM